MTTPYLKILEEERRAARRAPRPIARRADISVGDQIQYRFCGHLKTRPVTEIIDSGRAFVVEGFFNVSATQIACVIKAEGEEPDASEADTLEFE